MMAKIPGGYRPATDRNIPQLPYKRNRPKFRRWIIEIVLACLIASWAIHSVEPAISWRWISNLFGVSHHREFSMLGVLCLLMIGYLLIKQILRKNRK